MRVALTASIILAAAATALPGAAQARGVFGCDAAGGKQEGGAVIGAIVGGLIGNQIAKNERGAGTAIGAVCTAQPQSEAMISVFRSGPPKALLVGATSMNCSQSSYRVISSPAVVKR